MNTLNSIRSRILILIGIILVAWITFGILSITTFNSSVSLKSIHAQLNSYYAEFSSFQDDIRFFIENPHSVEFYETEDNQEINALKNKFFKLNSRVDKLQDNAAMFYMGSIKSDLESHEEFLESLKKNLLTVSNNIRTVGDKNNGRISEWLAMNYTIENLSYEYTVSDDVSQLFELQQAYIENPGVEPIDQITRRSDQIINNLESAYAENDSIGSLEMLTTAIRDFSEKGNSILLLNSEIGFSVEDGMKYEIVSSISDEKETLQIASRNIENRSEEINQKGKKRILWTWVLFFMMILIGSIYVGFEVLIPIKNQQKIADQLSTGEIPEEVKGNFVGEYATFFNRLNQHAVALREKADYSISLSEGNLDKNYTPISDKDEIGKALVELKHNLSRTQKEEKKLKQESEKRRWVNEGVAMMAETLRLNNDNLEELSYNIVFNIVKYLKAAQGGLFLSEQDEKGNVLSLDLKAAFAFNRRKFMDRTFELGEGLIGTCAVEKQTIFLKEIPDNYLEISSGLGDANPKCILIVPLKVEDDVQGVIEIASFNEFQEHEIEFIEKIAENVASTIISVKINERTAQLLRQSQQQAAEMSEKEEEMRQNMEELQATQEEAARRENEINSILDAINHTALVVEFDMEGSILNINERFVELLETPKSELIGINHGVFTSKNNAEQSYIDFWEKLNKGETIKSVEVIKLLNGKKLWLKQTYSPIFNLDNKPYKVINISQDISEIKLKEQSLEKQSQELLRKNMEIESINEAVSNSFIKVIMGLDGNIIESNENFAAIAGIPISEMNGRNFLQLMTEEDRSQYEKIFQDLLSDLSFRGVIKFTNPGNNDYWLMSTFTAVKDEKGEIYKVFMLAQNITEQKLRYQLLSDANEEIESLRAEIASLKGDDN